MSPLLMIESWGNAKGLILPQKIRALRHGYVLLSRAREHYSRHSPLAGGHPVLNLAEDVVRIETGYGGRADALPLDNNPGARRS